MRGLGSSQEVCPQVGLCRKEGIARGMGLCASNVTPASAFAPPVREPDQAGAGGELGHDWPHLPQVLRCHRQDQAAQGQLPPLRRLDLGWGLVHLPGEDVSDGVLCWAEPDGLAWAPQSDAELCEVTHKAGWRPGVPRGFLITLPHPWEAAALVQGGSVLSDHGTQGHGCPGSLGCLCKPHIHRIIE